MKTVALKCADIAKYSNEVQGLQAGKATHLYTNWRGDRNLRYYFDSTCRVVGGTAKLRTIVSVRGQYHQRATNPLVPTYIQGNRYRILVPPRKKRN